MTCTCSLWFPAVPCHSLPGFATALLPKTDLEGCERSVMTEPPPPLEWHPAYRGKTWLLDWLEQTGPYADLYTIKLPVMRPLKFTTAVEPEPDTIVDHVITMTRHKATGLAPYVGRPFVYLWYVGVDNLGRAIASDSHIAYLDGQA